MKPKLDIKNSNYIVKEDASLNEAMEAITYNHRGCVVVVDKDFLVLGVLSDGDIRRALVKGATMITPVSKVLNTNFVSVRDDARDTLQNPERFFEAHANLNVIPVLGEKNRLADILVRGGPYRE
ncbi:MAG: CBS domain-containing protein [Candidatus Spechtbacteria bacterium]|nr:CBS domain-containing protein [Candidatus Spechtbacteria bacterium]